MRNDLNVEPFKGFSDVKSRVFLILAASLIGAAPVHAAETVPDPVFPAAMRALFDVPLVTARNTLTPREADDPNGAVRCFSYPGFMVKEFDYGEHGDDRIMVHPIADAAPVDCNGAPDRDEIMLTGSEETYFLGAKGRYGFGLSTLGQDGSPFTIYDMTSKPDFSITGALFTDTMAPDAVPSRVAVADGVLSFDYLASASLPCSLPGGGAICWKRFIADAHVAPVAAPPESLCVKGYARVQVKEPSVVTFPVHLTIDNADKITVVTGAVISCGPQS